MSKNISIQEGGQGKAFGRVKKLKIAQSGGGETLWVPEEEVRTKSLYVSKNGTYLASRENVYGYDEVSVNITNGVTYTDDDVDYYIGVDDDGYLEEPEELPMYIRVVTPPTKTTYIVGEPINTAGMVVKAYYGDDSEYGEVPRDEYTLEPPIAGSGSMEHMEYSDGNGLNVIKITNNDITFSKDITEGGVVYPDCLIYWLGTPSVYTSDNKEMYHFATYWHNHPVWGTTPLVFYSDYLTQYDNKLYILSDREQFGFSSIDGSSSAGITIPSQYIGKFIHLGTLDGVQISNSIPVSTKDPTNITEDSLHPVGGSTEAITVIWVREDGKELTDTFEIEVSDPPIPPISGDDSGGGGSSGGSW